MTKQANKNKEYSNLRHFFLFCLMILLISLFAGSSCEERISVHSDSSNSISDNKLIIEWNEIAYRIANEFDQFYTFNGVRALAMTHLAIHDALNSIIPKYEHYSFNYNEPDADSIAAASQAAFDVLVSIYPQKRDTLQAILDKWLSKLPEGNNKTLGIKLGKNSAASIIQKREGDGYDKIAEYTPGTNIGDYQFTPGFDWVLAPGFRFAKPFGLNSADQFRSPSPPALASSEYAESYTEVKKYGAAGSSFRSQDQTNYAHWWAEFAEHSLNRIGRITAGERKLPLWETARMFALINMTLFDIYLAIVDSKYFHNKWRPYTAIRLADKDGNAETEPDTGWIPEMLTPPWPEYPSAHASCIAGGTMIIAQVYGSPNVHFTMESITALPNNKTRSYDNLDDAANECANSRIMNGYHFRFSTEEGKKQGRKVAKYIILKFL
ncbi:MAG: hypothetical protein ACM339_01945, partial [Ignavibacteria bacterium]